METNVQEDCSYGHVIATSFCRSTVLLLCLLSASSLIGCGGPEVVSIQGQVTMDGKALPNTLIRFRDAEGRGRGASARTDEQGWYKLRYNDSLEGIAPGRYKVEITTRNPEGILGAGNRDLVPDRYNRETELEVQVERSNKHLDFQLVG